MNYTLFIVREGRALIETLNGIDALQYLFSEYWDYDWETWFIEGHGYDDNPPLEFVYHYIHSNDPINNDDTFFVLGIDRHSHIFCLNNLDDYDYRTNPINVTQAFDLIYRDVLRKPAALLLNRWSPKNGNRINPDTLRKITGFL